MMEGTLRRLDGLAQEFGSMRRDLGELKSGQGALLDQMATLSGRADQLGKSLTESRAFNNDNFAAIMGALDAMNDRLNRIDPPPPGLRAVRG